MGSVFAMRYDLERVCVCMSCFEYIMHACDMLINCKALYNPV